MSLLHFTLRVYITGPHRKSYHCLSDTSNGTATCITASVLTSLDSCSYRMLLFVTRSFVASLCLDRRPRYAKLNFFPPPSCSLLVVQETIRLPLSGTAYLLSKLLTTIYINTRLSPMIASFPASTRVSVPASDRKPGFSEFVYCHIPHPRILIDERSYFFT